MKENIHKLPSEKKDLVPTKNPEISPPKKLVSSFEGPPVNQNITLEPVRNVYESIMINRNMHKVTKLLEFSHQRMKKF
jgi:hypothetical protein